MDEEKKTVSAKQITSQATLGENSAITGDIMEGHVVVVQGQDKLTEGAIVNPTTIEHSNDQAAVRRASP
jgi:hypothetical protein